MASSHWSLTDSRTTLGRAEGDLPSDPRDVPAADELPALRALQSDGLTRLAPACALLSDSFW